MSVAKKPWSVEQVARYRPWVFGLCLYPVFRWVWFAFTNQLTANPPEFLIRSTGLWALVGLCLTLSITPLRRFLHQPALLRFRRMLGLFTFFYTVLHVLAWGYWERGWSLNAMWQDIVQRPFVAIGVVAVVPMVALAATSTHGWMRRLGARWQSLHRLIYPIAILSVWHFWLVRAGKNDFAEVYVYLGVVAALLMLRLRFFR